VSEVDFSISRHAVDQYRDRVLFCPERQRADEQLRTAIRREINARPWKYCGPEVFKVECGPLVPKTRGWDMKVTCVTHTYVIEQRVVVTVLGFGMRTSSKLNRRKRLARRTALGRSLLQRWRDEQP
jgi:hypothetical protein